MIFNLTKKNFINYLPLTVKKILKLMLTKSLLESYNHYSTDIYLLSFPKCGRTWLRLMIAKTLVLHFNLKNVKLLNLGFFCLYNSNIPKITVTHDDNAQFKKPNQLNLNKKQFKSKKVILLVRDPRDVVVSLYFQKNKRDKIYSGNLSSFLIEEKGSLNTIIKYYNIWLKNKDLPKEFLLVRYEDMHKNPVKVLRNVINFIGINVSSKNIKEAVDFASFNNMRKMEEKNILKSNRLKPENKNDKESYKTRKGKIGDHINYFNKKEVDYINKRISDDLSSFFNYN